MGGPAMKDLQVSGMSNGHRRSAGAGWPYLPTVVSALLLLAASSESSAAPLFAASFLSFDTGASPQSVAIGDLNADGKSDLAVANTSSNTVSVLLGNGDGTFGVKTDFGTGSNPNSVAIGDLNADGKPDLAVASYGSSAVSVLLGNGDGSFGARTDFGTGSGPQSVAVGDLNADGEPDLAVANLFSTTVSVLLGNGDGTFGAKTDFGTGSYPNSVAIADLNADGKPDLAVANGGSSGGYSVSVLLGNGDGSFGAKTDFGSGGTPFSIAIGDLNADAKPDLAVANNYEFCYDQDCWSVAGAAVLLGNGDGTFRTSGNWETGADVGPYSVEIGDLNADGKPDLAAVSSTVSVLLGNGDGSFGAFTHFETGQNPYSLAIGDLNADGKSDLAVANPSSNTVSVLLGNGDGTLGAGTSGFGTGIDPVSISIGDLNADGKPDLAVANENSGAVSGSISVLLGNGDGTFGAKTDFGAGEDPGSVAIGDLNGDGKPDLAVANFNSQTVSVLLGKGDGAFWPRTDFVTGTGPQSVAIGDLDGDGKPDLATANYSSTVSVLLGNGDGTFGAKTDFGTGPLPRSVAIGDLNGDGKPDLAVANYYNTASVLLGNGDGTFGAKTDFGTGPSPYSIAIGDLNADGKPDLAVANGGSSGGYSVSVLLGSGDGTFGVKTDYGAGGNPVSVAIADLNADANLDLAVANYYNTVSVLLGNGDGTFGAKTDFGAGIGPRSVAIGDLNADGRPDLAVANEPSNTVSVLRNLGPGIPTAISLVMLDVRVEVGRVRISWYAPGAEDLLLTVYRRTAESDWVAVGQPHADINNRIVFEDGDVTPGGRYAYRLLAQGGTEREFSSEVWVLVPGEVGAPTVVRLEPSYPNPFGVRAQFNYGLPKAGQVRLAVYDLQGRRVATVVDRVQAAGWRSVFWDGRDERGREVASGAYFARLESAGEVRVRKIVIAR